MAFKDFPGQKQGVQLLQRSLERGRLAHAYLFAGHEPGELEGLSAALAKTLNCREPVRAANGTPIDCCDACLNCRRTDHGNHPDIHWVRPESRLRVITVDQMRSLMQEINLKPAEADYKAAIIVGADRLNLQAANAFLKTLEEPPPRSLFILLATEPQRILETILSRCLRLNFSGDGSRRPTPEEIAWLAQFSAMAVSGQKSLLSRYRLMDVLLQKLNGMKGAIDATLTARSPLQRYDDVEKDLRDRWEDELKAAIEAEYRRQRADLLSVVQRWLRDVWVLKLDGGRDLLDFPDLAGTDRVAGRITQPQALENLDVIESTQRLLHTNVQEALAIEVGLLKLHL